MVCRRLSLALVLTSVLGLLTLTHMAVGLRHQGQSNVYWNMWVRSFRSLCDSWVMALSHFPAVPVRLRDKYLAFAVAAMEWRPHHTVGHWDTIRVPINRLVPSRVLDELHRLLCRRRRTCRAVTPAAAGCTGDREGAGERGDESSTPSILSRGDESSTPAEETDAACGHAPSSGGLAWSRRWLELEHARLTEMLHRNSYAGSAADGGAPRHRRPFSVAATTQWQRKQRSERARALTDGRREAGHGAGSGELDLASELAAVCKADCQ